MKTILATLLVLLTTSFAAASEFADYQILGGHLFSGQTPDGIPAITNPVFL